MKQSDLNHLRRLIAYERLENGPEPEEIKAMMQDFAAKGMPEPSPEAKQRMVEWHDKSRRVPQYVRAAVKALSKYLNDKGEISDAEPTVKLMAVNQDVQRGSKT